MQPIVRCVFALAYVSSIGCLPAVSPDVLDSARQTIVQEQVAEVNVGNRHWLHFFETRDTDLLLQKSFDLVLDQSRIQSVILELTDVTEVGIEQIAELPNIRSLTIDGAENLPDDGLEPLLASKTLQQLKFVNLKPSIKVLQVIRDIPHLKTAVVFLHGSADIGAEADTLATAGKRRELERVVFHGCEIEMSQLNKLREYFGCEVEFHVTG